LECRLKGKPRRLFREVSVVQLLGEEYANDCLVQLENVRPTSRYSGGWELMVADRTKRVKEARDEAKKEIEDYKKQKDDEFKKFESEVHPPFLPGL